MNLLKLFSLLFIILLSVVGAYASTITVTSLPSASNTGLAYKWTTNSWENYCPNCGSHDCLTIDPKMTYENELTCSICDSDFCGSSGKEKGHTGRYLIPAIHLFRMPIVWNYNYTGGLV